MPRAEIKARYACKRKPDIITGIAIFLFCLMIVFQLYLIIILPIQIKKAETLELQVERQKMMMNADKLRLLYDDRDFIAFMNYQGRLDPLRNEEYQAVFRLFQKQCRFLRDNSEKLDLQQARQVIKMHRKLLSVSQSWLSRTSDGQKKPIHFFLKRETVDRNQYLQSLKKKIQTRETL